VDRENVFVENFKADSHQKRPAKDEQSHPSDEGLTRPHETERGLSSSFLSLLALFYDLKKS